MNIALKTYSGLVTSRPDTTWERENRDWYIPDFVTGVLWSPVLFTRIRKAGKCIGKKYADRYTDGMGFGLLLHPLVESAGGQKVPSSCMDHTTILPFPLYNKVVLDTPGNEAVYLLNGNEVICSFCTGTSGSMGINPVDAPSDISSGIAPAGKKPGIVSTEFILDAICEVSRFSSLRIGDIVATELLFPTPLPLADATDKTETEISGTFCDNGNFSFRILK